MPVRHLSYTRTGKIFTKKPCVLMEGEQHGSNSTQSERLHLIKQDSNLRKNEK